MTARRDFIDDNFPERVHIESVESYLLTPSRDLAHVSAEEAYFAIEECRQFQHDTVVLLECRRRGIGFQDEKLNEVRVFTEKHPPVNQIPHAYLRLTPDIIYFDTNDKLHVVDVTLTLSDPERAKTGKILKYSFFAAAYPGALIDSVAIRRTEQGISDYLKFFSPALGHHSIRLMNRYNFLIRQAAKNPDFPIIQSRLNSSQIPLEKFEHFDVDFSSVPDELVERMFGSRVYFQDFLNLSGPFKGFSEENDADKQWLDNLVEYVDKKLSSTEADLSKICNKERFQKAVLIFKEAHAKVTENPASTKEFYKIIPVPFVKLNPSSTPRSAVEVFLNAYTDSGLGFLDILIKSFKNAIEFKEALPFFRGSVVSENYKLELKSIIKKQEGSYKSMGSRIVNRRTFQTNFRTLGIHSDLVKLTGIDLLKEMGKSVEKQFEFIESYGLDHDLSVVDQLKDWFIRDTGGTDSMLVDPNLSGTFGLSRDLLSELKIDLNLLIAEQGGANAFKLANFYTKLYTEIAFMGEQNLRGNNVVVSTLGSTNCLVILHGGGPLGRAGSKRKFWLVFEHENYDFPLRASNRCFVGPRFTVLYPINVDSLTAAHHLMTEKFTWDVCFGSLLDSSKQFLSHDDRIDMFFTRLIPRFSNLKPLNILLMNVRYTALACSAFFCNLETLLLGMATPSRDIMSVYFLNKILSCISDFYDPTSGRSHVFKSDISQDPDDKTVRTVVRSPRFLGPGFHDSAVGIIDESYYFCSVSKEIRSRYHSMAEAFNKLLESKSSYDSFYAKDPWLTRGFSPMMEQDDFLEYYLNNAGQTCFNAKAMDICGKLMKSKMSNQMDIQSNLDHKMTINSILTFATNKAMVTDPKHTAHIVTPEEKEERRLLFNKKRLENQGKRRKTVNRAEKKIATEQSLQLKMKMGRMKMYDWIDDPLSSKDIEMSGKGKAIEAGYKYIKTCENVKICTLYKIVMSKFTSAFFTLFPKPQDGGGREIAIQDFYTRVSSYFLERMTESVCKYFEEEMITKASRKSKIQGDTVKKYRSEQRASFKQDSDERWFAMFDNCDHTRWGPSHNVLSFLILLRPFFTDENSQFFKYFMMGVFRMCSKVIEVPKELLIFWTRDFDAEKFKSNPALYEVIMEFKRTGKTSFHLFIGMMQGICNLGSTAVACGRVALVDYLVNNCRSVSECVKLSHMVSSDDKHSAMLIKTVASESLPRKIEAALSVTRICIINNITGLLTNCKESDKKTMKSMEDSEFNSHYLIDGVFVPRSFIDYKSLSASAKAISYESDVLSMMNGVQALAYKGLPEVNALLFQITGYKSLENIYNLDKRFSKTDIIRPLLPIELGGNPVFTTLEMFVGVKSTQSVRILRPDVPERYVSALCRINSCEIDLDNHEVDEPEFSSISVNFLVRLNSRIDTLIHNIKEIGCETREEVKSKLEVDPWIAFVDPNNKPDLLTKLMNRVYSHQSKVAFSYENDISNLIRMVKMSSSNVCYIGKTRRFTETDPIVLKEFVECVSDFLNEQKDYRIPKLRLERILFTDGSLVTLAHTLSSTLLVRDPAGRLCSSPFKTRSFQQNIVLQMAPLNTKNAALNVLINKWYPTSSSRSRDLVTNAFHIDSDFLKIQAMFPEIKDTCQQTSLELFGSDSHPREAFDYAVTLLRKKSKTSLNMYTKTTKTIFDRDFIVDYFSTNIYRDKEYRIGDGEGGEEYQDLSTVNIKAAHIHQVLSTLTSIAVMICDSDVAEKGRLFRDVASDFSSVSSELLGGRLIDVIRQREAEELLTLVTSDKAQKNMIALAYQLSPLKGMELKQCYLDRSSECSIFYLKTQKRLMDGTFNTASDCTILVKSEVECMFSMRNRMLTVTTPFLLGTDMINITKNFKSLYNNVFLNGRGRNTKLLIASPVPTEMFSTDPPGSTHCMCLLKGRVYITRTEIVRPLAGTLYAKDTIVKMKEIQSKNFMRIDVDEEEIVELKSFTLGTTIAGKDCPIFRVNRQMFDPTSVTCATINPNGIYGDFLDLFNAAKGSIYPKQFVPDYSKVMSMVSLARKTDVLPSPSTPQSESDTESIREEQEEEEDPFDLDAFDYKAFEDFVQDESHKDDVFGDYEAFEEIPDLSNYSWGFKKPNRARYMDKYNDLCKHYTRRIYPKLVPNSFNHLPNWLAYYFWNCIEDCASALIQAKEEKMVMFGGSNMSEAERIAIWNSITIKTSVFGYLKTVVGSETNISNFQLLREYLVKQKIFRSEVFGNYYKNRSRVLDDLGIIGASFLETEDEEV